MDTTTEEHEEWRPVVGYEGLYEVSNLGRVRSLDRHVAMRWPGHRQMIRGRIKRLHESAPTGYLATGLARDGQKVTKRVHLLVLEAFVGPRPDGMEACHNNGDMHDNRASNLRWDTKRANAQDVLRHGRNFQARKTRCIRNHDLSVYAYIKPGGGRQCRECQNEAERKRNAERKAQQQKSLQHSASQTE